MGHPRGLKAVADKTWPQMSDTLHFVDDRTNETYIATLKREGITPCL